MPYRVRVFCTGEKCPSLTEVVESARASGIALGVTPDGDDGLDSPDWTGCEITYDPDRHPIVVECDRDEGEDSLVREEAQEFIDRIEDLPETPSRERVIDHLQRTQFIVACQLLSDIDDRGHEAKGAFLRYFVTHCGGLLHADGEGFYQDRKLILETG
jgi:hypothetical protein